MASPLQIRPYEQADWPAVWALLEPVFRAGETFPHDPAITEAEARVAWVDQSQAVIVGGLSLAAGWLSFASIALRVLLTTAAALLLVASTGMPAIGVALRQLRVPEAFVTQLQLLYRYLFLLGEEAMRMERARDLRSCGRRGTGLWVSGTLLGALLLRAVARAQRIYDALLLRGYSGSIPTAAGRPMARRDLSFLLGWSAAFLFCRKVPVGELLGHAVIGAFG